MPGMPVPQRITNAIDRPNYRALVLRRTHRAAVEEMENDARTIAEILGSSEVESGAMKVSAAHTRITLANGSRIIYLGGQPHHLEQRVRGMSVQHIDGASLINPLAAEFILR